ncbi:hypothetical protein ACFXPX_26985 [Kitasatospora sp. NPDC059146]|uniref:hypothetical protein n=1 Tax=Kitasatospora sp. NPDC059146 TaxID=3346741 RepID=UPI0036B4ACB6
MGTKHTAATLTTAVLIAAATALPASAATLGPPATADRATTTGGFTCNRTSNGEECDGTVQVGTQAGGQVSAAAQVAIDSISAISPTNEAALEAKLNTAAALMAQQPAAVQQAGLASTTVETYVLDFLIPLDPTQVQATIQ